MPDLWKTHLLSIGEVLKKHSVLIQVKRVKETGQFLVFRTEGQLLQVGGLGPVQDPFPHFCEFFVLLLTFTNEVQCPGFFGLERADHSADLLTH
jgi:hypothetical protein